MRCRICLSDANHTEFVAQERMFGTNEQFKYFQCVDCQCLQIEEIPHNMGQFYPPQYYSFSRPVESNRQKGFVRVRNMLWAFSKGFFTKYKTTSLLFRRRIGLRKSKVLPSHAIDCDSRILDVGCGSGRFLYALRMLGFKNLQGIDPYIDHNLSYSVGFSVLKQPINELEGKRDLIMFHHSLEHMANPIEVLKHAKRLLAESGVCQIRIPTVSSLAWRKYQTNWVSLDAPRHFFLFSVKSLHTLAERCGLQVRALKYDSTSFQFWGSEQYRAGIPLTSHQSLAGNKGKAILNMPKLFAYGLRARRLNANGDGDQFSAFLTHN